MFLANRVIRPFTFERMSAVASIVSLIVRLHLLMSQHSRRMQPMRRLMLYDFAGNMEVQVFGRRNTGRQLTICHFTNGTMDVQRRTKFRFRMPTISKDYQFTWNVQVFLVQSPTIRIRLRQHPNLPLRITNVRRRILTARGAIRIKYSIQLSKGPKTSVDQSIRASVFPLSTYLITQPSSNVALHTNPAIRESSRQAYIISMVQRSVSSVDRAIRARQMTPASPYRIYFRSSCANVSCLLCGITLRRNASTIFQVRIKLYPGASFSAILVDMVNRTLWILSVAIRYFNLSMTNSMAIIQRRPAWQRVIILMTISRNTDERLMIILFSVRQFLSASVVFLTFLMTLTIFRGSALFTFCPVITIMDIRISLVRSRLKRRC